MPDGVADRFQNDRLRVSGQVVADHAHRSGNPQRRNEGAVFGQVGDRGLNPLPKADPLSARGVQLEDGGADVLDRRLQVANRTVQPRGDLARSGPGYGALQVHARGEEPLYDVVVQVVRDPIAVGQHGQVASVFQGTGQRERHYGVVGEVAHQAEVFGVERRLIAAAGDGDNTENSVFGPQGHHDRGPLAEIGEHLYRVAEHLGDHRPAGTEHRARGGSVDRNPLTQNIIGVQTHGGGNDQGVNVVDGQVRVARNKDDDLLCLGQFTGAVGDQLQRPGLQVDPRQHCGGDRPTRLRPPRGRADPVEKPRIVDGHRRRRGQRENRGLVSFAEHRSRRRLGQVETAEHLLPNDDRHTKQSAH